VVSKLQHARARALLATSSLVAVMAAAAVPQALAGACTTTLGPGTVTGCTNAGVLSGINITSATVTSNVLNTGTISPGGINVTNSTLQDGITNFSGTIAGSINLINSIVEPGTNSVGIVVGGAVAGGISLDSASQVTGAQGHTAINISASTFTGGINNAGTISVPFAGMLLNNAIAILNGSIFAGGISNSGTIAGEHDGIVVSGVSNFSGGISNSGKITAFTGIGIAISSATFTGGISNTGVISAPLEGIAVGVAGISVFDSGTITVPSLTAIVFAGGVNTLTLGPGFAISGKVVGSGSDVFQLGGVGSGTFDLSTIGASQQYQGFTTFNVVSGTWTVSNTFSQAQAWNVDGGTLAGTGTLNAVNVNAGGTLAPGVPGSPGGTLNIQGNLVLSTAASYLVNISPSAASRALVTGTATVAGAAQVAVQAGFYAAGTKFTILTANGGVSGTFSSLTTSNGLDVSLSYDADDVFLTVLQSNSLLAQLPPTAPTNIRNVAAAIDGAVAGGATLPAALGSLYGLPAQTLQNDLNQLTGEAGTGAQESGFQMMNSFLSLLFDPFAGGVSGGGGPAMGFAPERAPALPPDKAHAND
jgi:hypothetical protein